MHPTGSHARFLEVYPSFCYARRWQVVPRPAGDLGRSSDNVVGQILRYMGYIRENWAEKEGKDVKGIILTPSYDEQLRLAAKEAGIKVLRLRIS